MQDTFSPAFVQHVNKTKLSWANGGSAISLAAKGFDRFLRTDLSGDYLVVTMMNLVAVSRMKYYFGPKIMVPLRDGLVKGIKTA